VPFVPRPPRAALPMKLGVGADGVRRW